MNIRYQLLPYMYTLFYLAHNTGSTVLRALAWEFPQDPSLAAADRQFFLGPAIRTYFLSPKFASLVLLESYLGAFRPSDKSHGQQHPLNMARLTQPDILVVTPVLEQGATTVDGVFPGVGKGEVYYDWYTLSAVNASAGENTTISAPLEHIPVYIRGNHVLPTQEPALVTRDARKNPWGVIAALSLEGSASGSLYVDDGASLVPNATLYVEVKPVVLFHLRG